MVIGLSYLLSLGLIVIIYGLLGKWVYTDAKEKGLPAVPWTIIALFAPGFLGLIIYFVYRSDKKASTQCPNCNSIVEFNSNFCPYCGYQCPPDKRIVVYSGIPKKIIIVLVGCVAIMSGGILLGISSMSYGVATNSPIYDAPIPAMPPATMEIIQEDYYYYYEGPEYYNEYIGEDENGNRNYSYESTSQSFSLNFEYSNQDLNKKIIVPPNYSVVNFNASIETGYILCDIFVNNEYYTTLFQLNNTSFSADCSGILNVPELEGQEVELRLTITDVYNGSMFIIFEDGNYYDITNYYSESIGFSGETGSRNYHYTNSDGHLALYFEYLNEFKNATMKMPYDYQKLTFSASLDSGYINCGIYYNGEYYGNLFELSGSNASCSGDFLLLALAGKEFELRLEVSDAYNGSVNIGGA